MNRRQHYLLVLGSALLVGMVGWTQAGSMRSANYKIERSVIGSGVSSSSANYAMNATIGQTLAGDSASANYILKSGFNVLSDSDSDGLYDNTDNCLAVANLNQRDTDGDNVGNACDADLNNDCKVSNIDFSLFKQAYGSTGPGLDADFNGDDKVSNIDFSLFKQMYGKPVGPSAQAHLCTP